LVCTNGSIVRRTEPCKRSAFTLFCRPRNALAHIVALVAIQWIEITGGHEDVIVFDVFVVCRNIFHKTKYREKTFKSHACLISIFYLKGAIFVNLELKAILRAIRGKNRPQDRIE
jgi:hypothetical protein